MMKHENFCIFILSHGRPNKVHTWETLDKCGSIARRFIVIDNEDNSAEEYIKNFGRENVIVFDKLKESEKLNTPDLSDDRRTIVYARNACFDIAEKIGIRFFQELDDDYIDFSLRYESGGKLSRLKINDYDYICDAFIDFLIESGAKTIAFAQAGDFIGGLKAKSGGAWKKKILRKAMNSFFCDTQNQFRFVGRINEDVNTYTSLGQIGELFLTVTDIALNQIQTQANSGGMTEIYKDMGTYLKSFYTVVFSPSCATVEPMDGNTYHRIHHRIEWNFCSPKILNEKWKK